jgi:hypothetical protein
MKPEGSLPYHKGLPLVHIRSQINRVHNTLSYLWVGEQIHILVDGEMSK